MYCCTMVATECDVMLWEENSEKAKSEPARDWESEQVWACERKRCSEWMKYNYHVRRDMHALEHKYNRIHSTYTCICITYLYINAWMNTSVYIQSYTFTTVCILCIHVFIQQICMYLQVWMYIWIYIYIYISIHTCLYMYTYRRRCLCRPSRGWDHPVATRRVRGLAHMHVYIRMY